MRTGLIRVSRLLIKRSRRIIEPMMDFMKKLNPFKRIHRQTEQSQNSPLNTRHHQQQLRNSDSKRKAADKELQHLNQKIEKILANLDENEAGIEFSREEECVVCLSSKATMKTYPCGHCVVCRLCFVKTIQSAVSERRLPLKCVVCRTKILKLKQQRARPTPRSWSRHPSNNLVSNALRGGSQPSSSSVNPRSTSSASASALTSVPTKQNPPNRSTSVASAAAGIGPHKPTTTKLMQPLLIYPATRPGDLKRRPGTGWMSPPSVSDQGIAPEPVSLTTATFRLRSKIGLGAAAAAVAVASTGGTGGAGNGGGVGGSSGAV